MTRFLTGLHRVKNKRDLDISAELFVKQLSSIGIKGIAPTEVQQLGQITEIFFRYYQNIFPDELKINQIKKKLIKLFKELILAEDLSLEIYKALHFYPLEIIEDLKHYRETDRLNALIDIKRMEQTAEEFAAKAKPIIYNSIFTDQRKQTEDDETAQIIRDLVSNENLDVINNRLRDFMKQFSAGAYKKTKESIKRMKKELEAIEGEVQRVIREGGPELRSKQFSDMTIAQWIKVLDDEDLFDYTSDLKYEKKIQKPVEKKKPVPPYEYKQKAIDKEKTEGLKEKLRPVVTTTVVNHDIPKEAEPVIADNIVIPYEYETVELTGPREGPDDKNEKKKTTVSVDKPEFEIQNRNHYDERDIAEELKKKHKDTLSI